MTQDRLSAEIARKTQLRQQVSTQLEASTRQVAAMSQEVAALMATARHTNSKLQVCLCECLAVGACL